MSEIDWDGDRDQTLNSSIDPDDTYIVLNAIGCRKCKTTAVSQHRHNFVSCECGSVFADGGHDYLKRVGDLSNIIELSVISSSKISDRIKVICDESHVIKEYRKKQQAAMLLSVEELRNK